MLNVASVTDFKTKYNELRSEFIKHLDPSILSDEFIHLEQIDDLGRGHGFRNDFDLHESTKYFFYTDSSCSHKGYPHSTGTLLLLNHIRWLCINGNKEYIPDIYLLACIQDLFNMCPLLSVSKKIHPNNNLYLYKIIHYYGFIPGFVKKMNSFIYNSQLSNFILYHDFAEPCEQENYFITIMNSDISYIAKEFASWINDYFINNYCLCKYKPF